jgi:hypothetical protein
MVSMKYVRLFIKLSANNVMGLSIKRVGFVTILMRNVDKIYVPGCHTKWPLFIAHRVNGLITGALIMKFIRL